VTANCREGAAQCAAKDQRTHLSRHSSSSLKENSRSDSSGGCASPKFHPAKTDLDFGAVIEIVTVKAPQSSTTVTPGKSFNTSLKAQCLAKTPSGFKMGVVLKVRSSV
jgi:hypothetical protein